MLYCRSNYIGPQSEIYAMILSDKYVFFLDENGTQLWRCPFGNISYCQLLHEYTSVRLVLYQGTGPVSLNLSTIESELSGNKADDSSDNLAAPQNSSNIDIVCFDSFHAFKMYRIFANYANHMGNPAQVIPIELLLEQIEKSRKVTKTMHVPDELMVQHEGESVGEEVVGNSEIIRTDNDDNTENVTIASVAIQSTLDNAKNKRIFTYRFGTVNNSSFPIRYMSTQQLIEETALRFAQDVIGKYEYNHHMRSAHAHDMLNEKLFKQRVIYQNDSTINNTSNQNIQVKSKSHESARKIDDDMNAFDNDDEIIDDEVYDRIKLDEYMKSIDERVMQLIFDWMTNHPLGVGSTGILTSTGGVGFRASRCLVNLIINMTSKPIQILNIEMLEGRKFHVFSTVGKILEKKDASVTADLTSGNSVVSIRMDYYLQILIDLFLLICILTPQVTVINYTAMIHQVDSFTLTAE